MIDFKPKLKSRLTALLRSGLAVVAVREGETRAKGFADEYSDLSLMVLVQGNGTKRILANIAETLSADYGVKSGIIFPEPAWHVLSQRSYLLDPSPASFYVDITVTSVDNPDRFKEMERQAGLSCGLTGNGYVWRSIMARMRSACSSSKFTQKRWRWTYI